MTKAEISIILGLLGLSLIGCRNTRELTFSELHSVKPLAIDSILDEYAYKYSDYLNEFKDTTLFPVSYEDGKVLKTGSSDWTSGYFPGILWMLYDYSHDEKFKNAAFSWTRALEYEKDRGSTDEIGIIINTSFGQAYDATSQPYFRDVIIETAQSLSERYDSIVGCIKSLNAGNRYSFPVKINDLVNLDILFKAWIWSNNKLYYQIATSHFLRTMENQFQKDFSIYPVVDYSRKSGTPGYKGPMQGYKTGTNWSRGLAWALYGFCMAYQKTEDRLYLDQAERIADYILKYLEKENQYIPYRNLDATGNSQEPKDVTSAAILATSFADLANFPETGNNEKYKLTLDRIINALLNSDFHTDQNNKNPFILNHCIELQTTGQEVDVSLIYADYYFLESLMKYRRLIINKSQ